MNPGDAPRSGTREQPPAGGFTAAENAGMELALELAGRGVRGANPVVGAVVLDASGRPIARGWHRGAGTPHAEAAALEDLGPVSAERAAELTLLCTLEPCSHTGRTGPCAEAIARTGIGRVVYATADGTQRAGGGGALMQRAGIEVGVGLLGDRARELNHRWFAARAAGRPFTTLHLAQTLDGRIAAADGTSQWITGTAARQHSHGIRARAEAIIAGTGTIHADNPRLTARSADGTDLARQPLRVVMGHRALPPGAAIAADDHYLHLREHDPRTVLATLAGQSIDHAMIEGGASIATAFLAAGLVDELWLYQAPLLLGAGRRAVGDLGIATLSDAGRWRYDDVGGPAHQLLGSDVVLHLEPHPGSERIPENERTR
ncbi:bifunctional diaminohydroxyphosphoribosylaminopyrimidine deaminase/5-amino-6-(5-phosphoribosylamino)uracil reductase RibD [Arthrobacter sp. JSM 101049]|uniref:bifunctional diaminohydroxyphosphoribosylaminopyrimidine deaminase/5-amino-6-(5-phosphoribosylamino)uracil reductase RibD n=1 Tax=Arthrobacter sp. JSM 101049 TaxID=929097 RepID=UPI003567FBF2